MVHEQKFKDFLSSTCQISVERIVLDLESEVMRGPGSIPTGGNILYLDFFHIVKPLMPILALLPMLCVCENPDLLFCLNWQSLFPSKEATVTVKKENIKKESITSEVNCK